MEIQTNWSVKDIKLLLQSKGISFSDCVEKQDLINRAIEKGILDPNDLSRLFPEEKWEIPELVAKDLFQHEKIFSLNGSNCCLSRYSVIRSSLVEEKKKLLKDIFSAQFPLEGDQKLDRAVAVMLGNVIGDALGAPNEFSDVRYGVRNIHSFDDVESAWKKNGFNRFALEPGQWTDDASMMHCLAESLIAQKGFNPVDLRCRFIGWWSHGYCNAFGYSRSPKNSVGLGGNISQSFGEFRHEKCAYTKAGDKDTSGNGSIMRNAPICIYFGRNDDVKGALEMARLQSLTTHQGVEAAECCQLLTFICMKGIKGEKLSDVLSNLPNEFPATLYSMKCLIESKQEERHENNKGHDLADRNWNWKDPNFRYSPKRARQQPGYIGSYAMDNLSMSLHCCWTTDSFTEALLKCVNMCGDSDSVAAVVGQIAGSFYGLQNIPSDWIKAVLQWDPLGIIPMRARLLYFNENKK